MPALCACACAHGIWARARSVAARCGCTLEAGRPGGAPEVVRRLRSRVALCVGLLAAVLALVWSSLYIWDIRVTVNDSDVPDQEILRVLDGIGVKVGSFWPAFSSDRIRSQALPELPGLCWLTVNVHGSRAEVIARAAGSRAGDPEPGGNGGCDRRPGRNRDRDPGAGRGGPGAARGHGYGGPGPNFRDPARLGGPDRSRAGQRRSDGPNLV